MKATKPLLVAGLAGAALAVLLGWQQRNRDLERIARLEHELAELRSGHRALLDTFLHGGRDSRRQLAESLGYRPALSSSARRETTPDGGLRVRAPALDRKALADSYEQQQKRFDAEPMDAAWAGTTRQRLEDIFHALEAQGEAIPRSISIDCRSQTCQIGMDVADMGEVDALVQPLLTEMGRHLPTTTLLPIPSADGQRIELQIFATNAGVDANRQ